MKLISPIRNLVAGFTAGLLSLSLAQAETVLFEDHFEGEAGTQLPVGSEETYEMALQSNAVLAATHAEDGLLLEIGPNEDGSNRFAVLHHRELYTLDGPEPLMFEFDLDLGEGSRELPNVTFGLGTWLGIDNYANFSNTFSLRFRNNHNRLAIRTIADGEETVLFDTGVDGFMQKRFRLAMIIDGDDFEIFVDGESVFEGEHLLNLEAFEDGAYPGFQMLGGGGTTHSTLLEWYRIVSNPEGPSTPPAEPRVVFSDDFSGYGDGPLPVGSDEDYRIAAQTNAVLTPEILDEQLNLTIGPNEQDDGNRFAVLHNNQAFRFVQEPHLFEFDVELGETADVIFGLGTWLGIDNYANFGDTFSLRFRNNHDRLALRVRNDSVETTIFDTGVEGFMEKEFSVALWIDERDVALFVDGQRVFEGEHGLDTEAAFAEGGYAGFQMFGGGDGSSQTTVFDNLLVTAGAPVPEPPEIEPGEIFWTNANAIRTAARDGSNPRTLVAGLERPIGIAIDPTNEHLYWVEDTGGRLMRANLDGTDLIEISTAVETGQHLALDEENGLLYWAEWDGGLYSASTDGTGQVHLIERSPGLQSTTVAVDPQAGIAYLGSALDGEVVAVETGGGETESVVTLGADTYGLSLSPEGDRFYHTNFTGGIVGVYEIDEGTSATLFDGRSAPLGITVSASGDTLYWAERTEDESNGNIVSASADGSGDVTVLVSGEQSPFGIAVMPETVDTPPYEAWAAEFGLTGEAATPEASPAGDGIANLVKFAMGLDPNRSEAGSLPRAEVEEIEGDDYLTFTLERNPEAADLAWHVELSADMDEWTSGEGEVVVVEETPEYLKVRDAHPLNENARRFFRLRLVGP